MQGMRVLVIDDDTEMLRRLATAFTSKGFEVHGATDGRMGLRSFAQHPPDVVVTDIIMPTQEGIETIVAMKRLAPEIKVIAMSGGGRIGADEFLDLARHLGADDVVAKPFRLEEMVARAARMAPRQQHDELRPSS